MLKKIAALALAASMLTSSFAVAQIAPPPLRPTSLAIDGCTKTATATAGAATLNKNSGIITTEALSTAAAATYTLTITNNQITVNDQVQVVVWFGTSTTGQPVLLRSTPGAGNVVIILKNIDGAAAFNGTLKVGFAVLKP